MPSGRFAGAFADTARPPAILPAAARIPCHTPAPAAG
jgi:hypothetical protein